MLTCRLSIDNDVASIWLERQERRHSRKHGERKVQLSKKDQGRYDGVDKVVLPPDWEIRVTGSKRQRSTLP